MITRTRRLTAGCALLLALGVTPAFTGAAQASAGATILSQTTYVDAIGYRHIVGEVQDSGTTNIEFTQISFDFYDSTGRLLGTDYTFSQVDRLAPGEKSPFDESFDPPAGYDHYTASVSTSATSSPPNHNFTTTVTNEYTDSAGYRHIVGTIRNDNTTTADYVEAVFTFYDGSGRAVDSDFTFVNTGSNNSLSPGQTASFDETVLSGGPAFVSYGILTQSSSAASPGGSTGPSPTPTAGAPTPTPTATSAPSPTPAAETTPSVSVAPSTISAGQRVTVTYHGTPNTTLDVYSKTQPATGYSKITTVTLDSSGYGTTSHAPRRNTRIMAKTAGGLASAQPLISVRSIASINAKRVGTRTYTFSGSVLPALTNRLVNLYRNGTLVAQARTNSSGVYSVTRTLARGTFSFQARTPNDTYNLGASSPARTFTIS